MEKLFQYLSTNATISHMSDLVSGTYFFGTSFLM